MARIGIVGAGAWGTALALVVRRAGGEALVWARDPAVVAAIATRHENPALLPGVALDPAIRATGELAELAQCNALLLAVPAQFLGEVAGRLAPHLPGAVPLVICAKGIERATDRLMTEVVGAALPGRPLAVLSGPTFAAEVARGLPTAVTLAAADAALGRRLVEAIGSATFRPYLSSDLLGTQIGGAVKNVLAIACGIATGRRLGDNARAALVTRGLAELMRLGSALGARPETLMGLSGLGDLVLTCTGEQSRNFSLGRSLGAGTTLAEAQAGKRSIAEGAWTAEAAVRLAARHGVELPICAAVAAVLAGRATVDEVLRDLLARPFRTEA